MARNEGVNAHGSPQYDGLPGLRGDPSTCEMTTLKSSAARSIVRSLKPCFWARSITSDFSFGPSSSSNSKNVLATSAYLFCSLPLVAKAKSAFADRLLSPSHLTLTVSIGFGRYAALTVHPTAV